MLRRSSKLHMLAAMVMGLLVLGFENSVWGEERAFISQGGADRAPKIRPDYSDVVIPPNIAPLNFQIVERGCEFRGELSGENGGKMTFESRQPAVVFSPNPWRRLLEKNKGTNLTLRLEAKQKDGNWLRFQPVKITVARETIDPCLVYRLLGPDCIWFRNVGIYQRNLENYDERPILQNSSINGGCINCHTFQNNRPDFFSFQIRPGMDKRVNKAGMILIREGKAQWLDTKSAAAPSPPGYHCWNPKAPIVAFSMSKPNQIFRTTGAEIRDVFEYHSDVAVLNLESGIATTAPELSDPERLETFPAWSADGGTLYFCSAKTLWGSKGNPTPDQIAKTQFDLMRVRFDSTNGTWGKPEVLVASGDTGRSCLEPRASPDGRFVLFCMTDYSGFPIHQAGCDLYLLNIKSGQFRRLDCNSNQADTWHSWSTNSRWFVFSSKRDNGLLARPYICYIDVNGRDHKPFVLPQKDPAFYETWLRTFNVPELVTGPVSISQKELSKTILSGFKGTQK